MILRIACKSKQSGSCLSHGTLEGVPYELREDMGTSTISPRSGTDQAGALTQEGAPVEKLVAPHHRRSQLKIQKALKL